MISWATPGTGWVEWGSTTAATGELSETYVVSNGAFTSSTQNTDGGSATYGGGPQPRPVTTSTTNTEEALFVSTSLAATYSTQHTTSTFVPFGSNSTATVTTNATAQVAATLPVSYLETTTRTNTGTTELTDTENNNGPDFTIYQAVGNEVLWVHPLTPVSAYFEPYAASASGYTATRTTVYPRTETVSVEPKTTESTLTNPEVTNAALSFSATTIRSTTVTSASGNSMPMPTFTRTFRYQTTTAGGSYQFSIPSGTIFAGDGVAGTTTGMVTATMLTSISKSYQFGTYQAAYPSTTSYTQYFTGPWGVENSFTYATQVGPTSALSDTTITAFRGISGEVYKGESLQGGFGVNAGPPVMSLDISLYGGSRAVFADSQSGAYFSAQSTVFFETAALNSQSTFVTSAPESSTIFPTMVTGMRGAGANTTRYSVLWSGPSYSATSQNSITDNTNTTYSGIASAVGAAVAASMEKSARPEAALSMFRIGGNLPDGITGVADAERNLVKVGTGTDTTTSMIGGQTTWSGNAALTFMEPISSVVINTSPSFEENADATVWAVSKYKQDPYPPYSLSVS